MPAIRSLREAPCFSPPNILDGCASFSTRVSARVGLERVALAIVPELVTDGISDNAIRRAVVLAVTPGVEAKLAPTSVEVGGVSAIIKPGKRAIAVKGDKVIGLSGFILPGNMVDVLVTLTDPGTKRTVTKTVLEKIPVLATGTEIQENDKGDPAPVDVYTLEVTPEQAETLALAATQGRIQFALRNVTDKEPVLTRGATIPQTLSSLRAPEPSPAPKAVKKKPRVRRRTTSVRKTTTPPKPKKRFFTVEIIQGDKLSKQEFVI